MMVKLRSALPEKLFWCLVTLLLYCTASVHGYGQVSRQWIGGASPDPQDWFDGNNWSPNPFGTSTAADLLRISTGDTPVAGSSVAVIRGGLIEITSTAVVDIQGDLLLAHDGDGTVTVNLSPGGSLTTDSVRIANTSDAIGLAAIEGSDSVWTIDGFLNVGETGLATFNINAGADVNVSSTITLGDDAASSGNSVGEVFLSDAGSTLTGNVMIVGDGGQGTLDVSNSAIVNVSNSTVVGSDGTGEGIVDIDFGATLSTGSLNVGSSGNGTMKIRGGGNVDVSGLSWVGIQSGSSGRVWVDGVGSIWDITSDLTVGRSGMGELEVTNQARVENTIGTVGAFAGGNGNATVSGPGSVWDNSGNLIIGYEGTGTLLINQGGHVENTNGILGVAATGDGTVTVDGVGSTWNSSVLAIGFNDGNGTLNVTGGAEVSTISAGLTSTIGQLGNSSGVVNVDGLGSKLSIIDDLLTGSFANGTLNISDGGHVSIGNDLVVAAETGSKGFVDIGGGGATLSVGRFLIVGDNKNGDANVTISDNGHIEGAIQTNIGPNGTMTLSGGTLTTKALTKNGSGTFAFESGTLTVDGGAFNPGNSYSLNGTAGTSILNLQGSATSTIDFLTIGNTGDSVLNLSDSHDLTSTEATIGASGEFVLDGGHFSVETFNNFAGGTFTFLSGRLTMNGDVFGSSSPVTIPTSGTLDGSGFVEAEIFGQPGSTIAVTSNTYSLGDPFSFLGFVHEGTLSVGSNTARLKAAGFAQLGVLTTLAGGTLRADNGVVLGTGDNLSGSGNVDAHLAAGFGSIISASGNLTLGDSSSPIGFSGDGVLNVGSNTVTINDSNAADLGVLTTLTTGGILDVANGAVIEFGDNITGEGTIQSPNDSTKPIINNGNITGDDPNAPITLAGYVKGVGTCDNCNITGTDAPGFSPAAVNRGSVSYNGTLEIEIGGTLPGSGYDQLNHILGAGIADLGGVLDVELIGGFTPSIGDSFEIITATSVLDTFDSELLPTLGGGLAWLIDYQPMSVALSVGLAGDFNFDGRVDAFDFLTWQRDPSIGLLSDWEANYGTPTTANTATVPEPSGLILTLIGLAVTSRRRQR